MDSISDAQRDMREAYFGGATGAVSSATAWLAAAIVATFANPKAGILTLVFGGTLIFPLSVVLSKLVGRSGKHQKGNPLAPLAIQGTFWMLLSIPIAIGAAMYKVELFFPAMLLVIGGRYFTFVTIYGMKIYWLFGAALAVFAFPLAILKAPVMAGAYTGAIIEYLFGIIIFIISKPKTG